MNITNSKSHYTALFVLVVIVTLLSVVFYKFYDKGQVNTFRQLFPGIVLLLLSTGLTILLLYSVTSVFGHTDFKKGILNFIVGDNGTYSLSRLQAVLWAIVILSCQISIILCLCLNINGNLFHLYQPVFSETALWLLGLSLTSTIAVKSITVANNSKNPMTVSKIKTVPKFRDILIGDNGLDFSKCQMLIWTLLAIVVFESKCYYFNKQLLIQPGEKVMLLLDNFYDDYNPNEDNVNGDNPYVPYLPWSFVVLMGLSQGVYVGKKLVPSFKLGDVKASKEQQLIFQTEQLNRKTTLLNSILKNTTASQASTIDKASLQAIQKEILLTQEKIDAIKGDINQINNYLNN